MIICSKCKTENDEGMKICKNCGEKLFEKIFCHNCGTQTTTEFAFCQKCGTSLSENIIIDKTTQEEKPPKPKKTRKIPKKVITLASVGVAVVLVAAIVLSTILSSFGKNNFALYIKDSEMYFVNTSKAKPLRVTHELFEGQNLENEKIRDYADSIGVYTQLSDNGKILFYIDKADVNSAGKPLYYRYVNKPDKESVKIDSSVLSYAISKSGEMVVFLKGNRALYTYDLKEKEKIASDVYNFYISDDGKKIIYINSEKKMYFKNGKKDKVKLDNDVSYVYHIDEDFNTIYYVNDENTLYKREIGKSKKKISSNVNEVIDIYDSGVAYYTKADFEEINLKDYIEDDMADYDATISQPEYPHYPSYWDYDTYEQYEVALEQYEIAYEAYKTASNAYRDKEERDQLRKSLDGEITKVTYKLYYFDGKKEKLLMEGLSDNNYGDAHISANESPLVVFSVYNQSEIPKVKLSEIESSSEVEEKIKQAWYSSVEKHIAVKDSLTKIDSSSNSDYFQISNDGKTIYFIDDISDDEQSGNIYKITVSGNKPKKPELYDKDVYAAYPQLMEDNTVMYYKNVKNENGDLYLNKKKIDEDALIYSYDYNAQKKSLIYITDYNNNKSYGTLKIYKNGKVTEISEDVHSWTITPSGDVTYLYDYSMKKYEGELYVYKNGKSKKIAQDVVALIYVPNIKYKGGRYYGW